jgi:hypothetical protein
MFYPLNEYASIYKTENMIRCCLFRANPHLRERGKMSMEEW